MCITKEDVEKIASLAKLTFSENEIERFRGHLEEILIYVDKLNELDTENVDPTYYVQHATDVMREDHFQKSLPREDVLKNAPAQAKGFFRVPKIINRT
ncbi:Asp-tRNA(Asn)/Glu-tRNA(Gln) amidotransferase subunit GatC [bacterium]|nr:Asp-tRNA(Asn)/Glu-tRNA(Gln) amidotransferase subunit GatC [bacterium]